MKTPALAAAMLVASLLATPAVRSDDAAPITLDPLSVLRGPVESLPGAAHYIDGVSLRQYAYSDPLRVLRRVPGVYVQEEDGFGLRPNIGIRGSGLDRSARITLLEDGVLIAPAPYSAPSAYYFPTTRRMSAIEVLKGPSSIIEGPRTTGGAINLRSTPIPAVSGGNADVLLGTDGFSDLHTWYGQSFTRFGWMVETVQQQGDGFKTIDGLPDQDTGYNIEDYVVKGRVTSDPSAELYQELEIKLGKTDQVSNETYLGLTDADFDASPYRRYAASELDQFNGDHEQIQATWRLSPVQSRWQMALTAYRNDFARNWFKLGQVNGVGISSVLADPATHAQELDWIRGMTSPDDAMTLRNNNRRYYSQGIQGVFDTNFELGEGLTQLEFGFRVHKDEEDRFQDEDGYRMDNGRLVLTTDNPGGSQSNRVSDADAWAVYAKADFELGDWHLIPGVRYENIDLVRRDYSTSDPGRLLGPTAVRGNHVTATIPGIGATYDLGSSWQLVGGIHKGFNPPGPGSSASEEESTNTEFGVRYSQGQLYVESMLFHNDYQNLVGTCTASTGGNCMVGDQFDGGEVLVAGLELTADYNLPSVFGNIGVPLELTYTYTPTAEFQNSFASGFDPWGDVMAGDRMPYMPENQLQFITGLAADRWGLYLNTLYVDEMRSEAGQGSIPADVLIPSHTVTDLVGSYSFGQHTELMWRVDNLLDREYIVSRRPAGLRPGKPRTAMIGVQFSF